MNLKPQYEPTGIGGLYPCLRGYGVQYMIGTGAAILAALDGDDPEYEISYVGETFSPKQAGALFGIGNTGTANAKVHHWGYSTSGNGRYTSRRVDDLSGASNVDSTSDISFDLYVGEWFTSSAGQAVSHSKNGATVNPNAAAQNVGVTTPNQYCLFGRPDSAVDTIAIGRVGSVCIATTPDSARRSRNRVDLGDQFGITVTP